MQRRGDGGPVGQPGSKAKVLARRRATRCEPKPIHVYAEVSPIIVKGAYSQVNVD